MNQLTTTNNHFIVETSIMEKIFDASGYNFHVLTIDGHKYWIGRELVNAFDYAKNKGSTNMFSSMDRKDIHTIRLTKFNGMKELKDILLFACRFKSHPKPLWNETSLKKTYFLSLVREDTLQEYLTLYARKPDAKEIGKKLYEYFTKPKTLIEVFEEEINPFKDLIYTEAERLGLSKEYQSWYWEYVDGIYWFEKRDYRANIINGVKCIISWHNTLEGRFMTTLGKNSAKKILKKQGASSKMLSSNRKIARVFNPISASQMTFLTQEFMKTVDLAIEESIKEGSMSREQAIITALSNPKAIFDKYVLEDEDNIIMLQSIAIIHRKGYADEHEKEFYDNHLTDKDKQLLDSGALTISMKDDYTQNLFEKKFVQKKLKGE